MSKYFRMHVLLAVHCPLRSSETAIGTTEDVKEMQQIFAVKGDIKRGYGTFIKTNKVSRGSKQEPVATT